MKNGILTLQNINIWLEVILFNTITEKYYVTKRKNDMKIEGHYVGIDDELIMFYRKENHLFLKTKNGEICLEKDNISLTHDRIGKMNIFCVYEDGIAKYSLKYPSPCFDPINMADFDFNRDKEEDHDFLLFVFNVMNTPERKRRIYNIGEQH